ncbi:hypothetical protein J6590_081479, partial [Homalodisca vitripennis]
RSREACYTTQLQCPHPYPVCSAERLVTLHNYSVLTPILYVRQRGLLHYTTTVSSPLSCMFGREACYTTQLQCPNPYPVCSAERLVTLHNYGVSSTSYPVCSAERLVTLHNYSVLTPILYVRQRGLLHYTTTVSSPLSCMFGREACYTTQLQCPHPYPVCSAERLVTLHNYSVLTPILYVRQRGLFTLHNYSVLTPILYVRQRGLLHYTTTVSSPYPVCSAESLLHYITTCPHPYPVCSAERFVTLHNWLCPHHPVCSAERLVTLIIQCPHPYPVCSAERLVTLHNHSTHPYPVCSAERLVTLHNYSLSPLSCMFGREACYTTQPQSPHPYPVCSAERLVTLHNQGLLTLSCMFGREAVTLHNYCLSPLSCMFGREACYTTQLQCPTPILYVRQRGLLHYTTTVSSPLSCMFGREAC